MGNSNASFDDLDDLDSMMKGKCVPTPQEQAALSRSVKWALKLIADFKATSGGSVWPGLHRSKVADELAIRVQDTIKINQSETWLCGITSAVRAWAQDCPVDYAWLGIQLFDAGCGRLGRGQALGEVIRPSFDLRSSGLPNGMAEADWLVLGSVHETMVSKYGHLAQKALGVDTYTKDEGFLHHRAWQNPSEVVAAYKAMGYKNVVDNTNTMSHKDINDLQQANQYFHDGWRVSWLINMRMLDDAKFGTQALIPSSDHWVGMIETINVMGENTFAFNVFSWGTSRRVPQNVGVRLVNTRDLLVNFFGYVAARPY
jgi:hypothetical protein